MLRKILVSFAALLLLLVVAFGIFLFSGPEFPEGSDVIITRAIESDPPELVRGTTGYASSGDIKIWYEVIQPPKHNVNKPKETIVLIMGAGASSMLWPLDFMEALTNNGYQVVRFDHRSTGMSDWMENWQKDQPYSLEDMANDTLAVMNAIGVRQAHIIGTSMGGMIAQRLAISHGDRVLSLVGLSTSGYLLDPALLELAGDFRLDMLRLIVKYSLTGSESGMIKMWMGITNVMLSDGLKKKDVRDVAGMVLYEMRKRRGFNRQAMPEHFAAIEVSGSRLEEMNKITCPVLVIHGTADTAIPITHAKKYAALIPDARTLWLEGEGHIIRDRSMPEIMNVLLPLFESAARQ